MAFKEYLLKWLRNSEEYKNLAAENEKLSRKQGYPPGHFYSPIVDPDTLKDHNWDTRKKPISGIEINEDDQLSLITSFKRFYLDLPYLPQKGLTTRYYFDNDYYTHNDAIALYSLIRLLEPKQIIEIGSGFSSAVMMDTNDYCMQGKISLSFIEPYPDRLLGLMNDRDKASSQLIVQNVQSVPLQIYEKLEAGDILFVDSSHVVKTGSDLHHIVFNILPILQPGVLIHFHDIFYPFEYPESWVMAGRNWNENYLLRAFLMYNKNFRIRLFSDFIYKHHTEAYWEMPLAYNVQGTGFWIEKTT